MTFKKTIGILIGVMFLSSCNIQMTVALSKKKKGGKHKIELIVENTQLKTYKGWWIYGEGQYIFKDEKTLDEYTMKFPNENMEELRVLYLAVCEMEYFPMECVITGHLKQNILEKKTALIVSEFEILYIQGCGE